MRRPRASRLAVWLGALAVAAGGCGDPTSETPATPAEVASVEAAFDACLGGDLDGGIASLDAVLDGRPGDPDALVARGLCAWTRSSDTGDPADARQAYRDLTDAISAVEDGAPDPETPLDQIYSHRAFVARLLDDDWTRTLEDLGRAAQIAPGQPGHVLDLGVAHAYAGDTTAARAELQRFLALADPADADRQRVAQSLLDDLAPPAPVTAPR